MDGDVFRSQVQNSPQRLFKPGYTVFRKSGDQVHVHFKASGCADYLQRREDIFC